jgi:Fe2+ transport system protein FeoA
MDIARIRKRLSPCVLTPGRFPDHAAARLVVVLFFLPQGATMSAEPVSMPLPLATPGEPVRVTAFAQGRDIEKRLAGMGVTLGCELRLLQHEGGNVVVAAGHTRLALGQGIAQKILVAPAGEAFEHSS